MEQRDARETWPWTYAASVILISGLTVALFARNPVVLGVVPAVLLVIGAFGAAAAWAKFQRRDWGFAAGFLAVCAVVYLIAIRYLLMTDLY